MTPVQIQIARRRLWLGITNVGVWVLTSAIGVWWLVYGDTREFDMIRLGLIFGAAVAAQSVFYFIGGASLIPDLGPLWRPFSEAGRAPRWFTRWC